MSATATAVVETGPHEARPRMLRALVLALAVVASCQVRSSEFKMGVDAESPFRGDVRPSSDGGVNPRLDTGIAPSERPGDGGNADACVPQLEVCNLKDDDCNGFIDDTFDLEKDPQNCGRCGNQCSFGHAQATCSLGKCQLDACESGFVNTAGLAVNGCECQTTTGGAETCDGKDNDCDGLVDDGFDLETSTDNCGVCGRVCRYTNAMAKCASGVCQMGMCDPGFFDLDASPRSGCEYACAITNGGDEICDGKDNNCNGVVDESDARVGRPCFPDGVTGCDVLLGTCRGTCAFGVWACLPGGLTCQGAVLPKPDVCDGKDNDCDGVADQDFDLQNDPRWCGACNRACNLPNAVNGCVGGTCAVASCRPGFVDLDLRPENGCEYACTRDGPEICDGKDNDCDGRTDATDDDILAPLVNFCLQVGECGRGPGGSSRYPGANTFPVCTTAVGATKPDWICNYPDTVQLFAPNQVLGQETRCDGKDNDCDASSDEHVTPPIGSVCADNGIGECRKSGVLRCQADKTLAPACDVSGAPTHVPTHETCDGKDNDCDGAEDESWDSPTGQGLPSCAGATCRGVRDDVVHVTSGFRDYYIYAFEATRVDATSTDQGTAETRACSRKPGAGVLPWTLVNHAQATAACARAGMRLCRTVRLDSCSSNLVVDDEWGFACAAGITCPGGDLRPYPYSCTYEALTCNGLDYGSGGAPLATGSVTQCRSDDLDVSVGGIQPVYDMSGNVSEWTEDCRGTLTDGTGRREYTLRGGNHTNIPQGMTCDFTSLVAAEDFAFTDTGFRCCSSCGPGLADCGSGVCANLGTSNNNCGACGTICPAGTTCKNGFCQ
jgi:hypothetical protein